MQICTYKTRVFGFLICRIWAIHNQNFIEYSDLENTLGKLCCIYSLAVHS